MATRPARKTSSSSSRKPPQIISIDEYVENKNILIYGDAGVGKTPFGASSPDSLIITTEPGTISAKRLGYKADVWPIRESWDEFVKAVRWLVANSDPERDATDQPHGYQWIVIDNATQLQEVQLRSIVATARIGNSKRDEDIPAIQDYQKWYLMFDRYVKMLNNLPVATLWLAHAMRKANADGDELVIPAIQGQDYAQAAKFCGRMMSIGYLEERTITRGGEETTQNRILWRKDQFHFTKDRYIFRKDTTDGRYTIASEGNKPKTDMAEISRRIDIAIAEESGAVAKRNAGGTVAKKTVAKKTTTRSR